MKQRSSAASPPAPSPGTVVAAPRESPTAAHYEFLRRVLRATSGLMLAAEKTYLLEHRLLPVALAAGLPDVPALAELLKSTDDAGLRRAVVEAMTTQETSFFRDRTPFDDLRTRLLPDLAAVRGGSRTLRLWCAGASTGQEPYSVALTLVDAFPELDDWNVDLLATDLSREASARGEQGRYSSLEIRQGLPVGLLLKHFREEGADWRLVEPIRRRVRWEVRNLLDDFHDLGRFDVILCRNVLHDWDTAIRLDTLRRLTRRLASDGALILGEAETLEGVPVPLVRDAACKSAVYRPFTSTSNMPR